MKINQYLVPLRATTIDCNFLCPHCEHDLSDTYIKDQFIRGIADDALQTDLLAKAGVLKSLDQNICHAEAFESALWNQTATWNFVGLSLSCMAHNNQEGLQSEELGSQMLRRMWSQKNF